MNCKLIGSFVKHLEIELSQGEEFYAERGAVIYIDEGLDMDTELSGNSLGKLLGSKLSGESLFIVHVYNPTPQPRKLAIGSHSGLTHFKLSHSEIICRKGAFMASSRRVDVSTVLSITGLMGGMGALLQRVTGDATVFLQSYGDPVIITLTPRQSIRIDENHFLALEGIPESRISAKWSARNFLGGEGLSMISVTGPGKVYLNP